MQEKDKPLGLLYFWRLEQEKGVDGIIEMVRHFAKEGKIPFELFIFGGGSLEPEILELAGQHREVHYFGWKPLSEIQRYVENCQYCLMPSTFLETFGLSALTALTRGLPVIGYKKGGLIPFIDSELDLGKFQKKTVGGDLIEIIQKISSSANFQTIDHHIDISLYTKTTRQQKIKQLLGDKKKILLVSDFVSKVGGIETYIHDVKAILEEMGYEVKLFGTSLPLGFWGKIKKLMGIARWTCNFVEGLRLRKLCKSWEPDLVRYHSTLRRLGWMPLWATKDLKVERWMMYHDFGYFYPYPSRLTDIHQIKTPLSWKHFWAMGKTKNPIKLLFLLGKYISVALLKKQCQSLDKHLVPSDFMETVVQTSYGIPTKKITPLNHFLQN